MIINQPAFEIITETAHIKIWADGRIEGIKGTVINRIPLMQKREPIGDCSGSYSGTGSAY